MKPSCITDAVLSMNKTLLNQTDVRLVVCGAAAVRNTVNLRHIETRVRITTEPNFSPRPRESGVFESLVGPGTVVCSSL